MRVLGIVDSFKGNLTSKEIGEILKEELKNKVEYFNYLPISDGGEGFLDMFSNFKYLDVSLDINDPLFRKIKSSYLIDNKTNTAFIELARASGFSLLKKEELNPFITSTYGLGEVINDAISRGVKNFVIGIGGSSTNDGGAGMLEALGVKFYNKKDELITKINNQKLKDLDYIDDEEFKLKTNDLKFLVISDVKNPLIGSEGATYTYARQKGAKFADLEHLEANLINYSRIVENTREAKFKDTEYSGAAGGIGFAMGSFFNSEFKLGITYALELIKFEEIKDNYDYIITGEGRIDNQSLNGKVVFEIARKARKARVIAICALNELKIKTIKENNIDSLYKIVPKYAKLEESLKNPKYYLKQMVKDLKFVDENSKIGTLSEKSLHKYVKDYLEPNINNQEIKVGSYFVDILRNNEVIEIQTKHFNKLRAKLEYLLKNYKVTISYPHYKVKYLEYMDDDLNVLERRKSPKKGNIYDVFLELYKIKYLLKDENLKIKVLLYDMKHQKIINSKSKRPKYFSYDQIPLSLEEEVNINCLEDYLIFLPSSLKEEFTSKDFKKEAKIPLKTAQIALNILNYLNIIKIIGKDGRYTLYARVLDSSIEKANEI